MRRSPCLQRPAQRLVQSRGLESQIQCTGQRTGPADETWSGGEDSGGARSRSPASEGNSGTGEEWADKENALTAAEAQAFKRSLSCFRLGRYLCDVNGEWVNLDEHRVPTKIPKLPRWATPNGWMAGLRPKPRRNRPALIRVNGHAGNRESAHHEANDHRQSLVAQIEVMEGRIGKRFHRGLLKKIARAWSPGQIQEGAVLEKVLAQMQGAERGMARLEAARARRAPEAVQGIVLSLNAPPAKLEDLQTLHALVVAFERAVERVENPSCLDPAK